MHRNAVLLTRSDLFTVVVASIGKNVQVVTPPWAYSVLILWERDMRLFLYSVLPESGHIKYLQKSPLCAHCRHLRKYWLSNLRVFFKVIK